MRAELRNTGIDIIGAVPWGTHFCHFYETNDDLLDILIPFFRAGLEAGELCLWLVFPPHSKEKAKQALRQAIPHIDERISAGDMQISNYSEWYIGGAFNTDRVIRGLLDKLTQARAKGYEGIRATGNKEWSGDEDWKTFSVYEEKVNRVIADQRTVLLCTYPLAMIQAAGLFDVARTHGFASARSRGKWQVLESLTMRGAWAEMKKLNRKVEERIDERTKELNRANDELERRVRERTGQLEREKDLLTTVMDSMTDGLWLVDAGGRIALKNRAAREQARELDIDPETLHGPDMLSQVEATERDGKPLGFELLASVLKGNSVRDLEVRVRRRDRGGMFHRRLSLSPLIDKEHGITGGVVLVHDITAQKHADEERSRLEEQLRQAQKMESIGTLAGGIAHDFNNMLAVIMGNSEMALDDLTDNEGPAQNIRQILSASKRARDLTKQILMFSRKTASGRSPINLTPLVKETFKLLRGTLPTTIGMELHAGEEAGMVRADASQIQQVLINLATNAAYAMRKKGGILTFGLSREVIKQEGQILGASLPPGEYIKLSVRDTGTGMSEEVIGRVFEPFFTTKGPGKGTGMGLAVVYGIVRNHEGDITVESVPGRGSIFNVYLPMVKANQAGPGEKEREAPRGEESILLVDDDQQVLQTTSETLQRLGYSVTTAKSGAEALRVFRKNPSGYDMVLTDQVMPGVTGVDLAKAISAMTREIPTVLITGHSETVSEEQAKKAGVSDFVMKPVTKEEIAGKVRRALDRRAKA